MSEFDNTDDDVIDNEPVQVLPDDDELVIDDVSSEAESEAKEEDDRETYSRRVQKRLDKLVYERNKERDEAAKLRAELEELRQQRQQASAEEVSQKIRELQQQKREALEIGEYDKVIEIDDQLFDLKAQSTQRHKQAEPPRSQPANQSKSEAQQEWEANNQWVFDANQSARLQKANQVFSELLQQGFDANDPDTFAELDKKLKRQPLPPTGAPERGQSLSSSGKAQFSNADRARMRGFGLDPDNAEHRKAWLKNKAGN